MNNKVNWLVRVILLWLTFVFQVTFISASPVNLGFNPHNPVSETCIDDGNGNSNRVIDGHNSRVNWAILKSEVGVRCKILVSESRVAARGGQTIIGEGMKRVNAAAAKNPGSTILNDMPKFSGTRDQITSKMMEYNRKWLLEQMRTGRPIMDIGLDPTRANPSIFYQMEQNMLKNYLKLHPDAFKVIKP